MKIFLKGICTLFVLAFLIQSVPLTATEALIAQQTPPPVQAYPVPPSYYGTQAQYYYNMNNPYANSNAPYGFYGGFYGSPPPPTPSQAFPDKAAADNLYRYIQNR